MKTNRHSRILELIADQAIDTQEGLLEQLKQSGFDVTQATVSRDIRELGIHKVRADNGRYRYVSMQLKQNANMSEKFSTIFTESVKSVDFAQNMVVVKCYSGMANAACAALDSIHWNGVVGTLAGDDTIFVLIRNEERAIELMSELKNLLSKKLP